MQPTGYNVILTKLAAAFFYDGIIE